MEAFAVTQNPKVMSAAATANIASFCISFMLKSSLPQRQTAKLFNVTVRPAGPSAEDAIRGSFFGFAFGAYDRQPVRCGVPPA